MEEEEVNSAEGSDASDPIDLNNLPDYACKLSIFLLFFKV